jgi:soluble lytic murein transglycosylase
MTGWWKSLPAAIRKRSVSIHIRRPSCAGDLVKTVGKAQFFRTLASFVALLFLLAAAIPPGFAQTASKKAKKPAAKAHSIARKHQPSGLGPQATDPAERELALLSRALRENGNATTYGALSAFAARNAKNDYGAHAALALAFYDLSVPREKPDLALGWLRKATGDALLREYVVYWQSQALLALGKKEEAFEQLQTFVREFPESVMTDQAITSMAQVALEIGKADDALAALVAYPTSGSKPALLLLRAQAEEKVSQAKGEKPVFAATDYLDLYYRFPLNDESKMAGQRIPSLQFVLGEAFPSTPMQTRISRAEAFYLAKRWHDARTEYTELLPKLSGSDRERAQLRIAQCDVQSGGRLELLNSVSLTDPELDAERLFTIAQEHRSKKLESQMLDDIDRLTKQFPNSAWVEDGLFAAGNYYWVNLDRSHASDFYQRAVDEFPGGRDTPIAAWRVAWTAYLDRKPEAADMLEAYVRRFPLSSYVPDALYWLGRSYERSGYPDHARSFYVAAASRFPLTYFGARAAERMRPEPEGLGPSPLYPAEVLSMIPPAPKLPSLDEPLTAKLEEREERARALSDIAFDSSAELEYRAAFAVSRSPKFLVEAAGAAVSAGHYAAGMVEVRQAFPQLEARRVPEIPAEAWRAAFPLPYEPSLRDAAARNQLDPMLVAGLIRQESAFESNAMSRVGAVGLMQVMPKTATKLARQLKVRYVRSLLTDPGYNLQLGSRYLANLIQAYGNPEAALAAYNAGEDRVAQWTAGQNYLETAEFVESIPFTETREYVQIVMRNAEVYRQVYGAAPTVEQNPAHMAAVVPAKAGIARPVKAGVQR